MEARSRPGRVHVRRADQPGSSEARHVQGGQLKTAATGYLSPNSVGRKVESVGDSVMIASAKSIARTNGHTAREISSNESRAMFAAT